MTEHIPPEGAVAPSRLILTRAPSIVFLYGLAGSGKNFVGDLLAELAGWHVYHADEDLTDELKQARNERRSFTDEMRDRYFEIVTEKTIALSSLHKNLVVTQGAYKVRHREYVSSWVPGIEFICVSAKDELRVLRLKDRGDATTPEYEALIRRNFESPKTGSRIIWNNEDAAYVVGQLRSMFE